MLLTNQTVAADGVHYTVVIDDAEFNAPGAVFDFTLTNLMLPEVDAVALADTFVLAHAAAAVTAWPVTILDVEVSRRFTLNGTEFGLKTVIN